MNETNQWFDCREKMPKNGQRVLCKYEGVYGPIVASYWFDGVNHHFGIGANSQPATHWKPLNPAAVALGRLGGSRNTPAQQEARRINGKKGGQPRTRPAK